MNSFQSIKDGPGFVLGDEDLDQRKQKFLPFGLLVFNNVEAVSCAL